jgi:hypothetical protein
VQKLVSYFFTDYRYKEQSAWFKKALYGYVLLKCIYWLIRFPLFFGRDSIIYYTPVSINAIKDPAFLLYTNQSPALNAVFIVLLLIICLSGFFYKSVYFMADLLIWFLALNIHNVIYPALSGGDHLLNQFLFFNCFLSFDLVKQETLTSNLKTALHNFASTAILLQVCIAYFISALSKLDSCEWLRGSAIATISGIKHFSLYSSAGSLTGSWLAMPLNYLILFYQLLFPILVWIRPLKKTFLIAGICMHLYIGLVMGLPWFALIMITGYIFFWPFQKTE